MVSTDISGEPILILGLRDVRILLSMVDMSGDDEQDRVMQHITRFLNSPECLLWESKRDEETE